MLTHQPVFKLITSLINGFSIFQEHISGEEEEERRQSCELLQELDGGPQSH